MILDDFKLTGKVAVVTGASTGLGQAMAVGLAEAGADVVITGNSHALDDTAASIEAVGQKCLALKVDLTNQTCAARIIEQTATHFGRVDILVNNAGSIRRAPAIDFSEKDWDDILNLNAKTVFFLSQAAARQMLKQGEGGKIINIASLLSFQGGILVPSYAASKGAVASLTKALANEWAPLGINVNAIAPGYFITNVTEGIWRDEKRNKSVLERIPAGRWGNPKDLQGAVVFLASQTSNYLHGSTLLVDGGWMGR
ncbi:MAG: 2-dehydro-3-deoxy-D-gluconate 5-dehydrogenase KduD [Syntrophomonadaceae bacterium]|nr:2-dehydro-3-deoxy-D-gluconate 5-dehydrogenase KduD [Syntrophomonadaceae bacterium]